MDIHSLSVVYYHIITEFPVGVQFFIAKCLQIEYNRGKEGGEPMLRTGILYSIWAALYILCVGLGTLEQVSGPETVALMMIAVAFFVPGVLLLADAISREDRKGILRIRLISALSLGLTLVALVSFFLAAATKSSAADVLYEVLILVSAPMACSQYWLISLFLWACLFFATFHKGAKGKK